MISFLAGFGHAGTGILHAVRGHRNLRLHLLAALLAFALALWLRVTLTQGALLTLAAGLVLGAELLNSALEEAVDALHPDVNPGLGRAKDMAAGGVLLAAAAAALTGALIFIPALLALGTH